MKYGASPGKQQPTAALPQCNVIYDTVGNVFNSEPVRRARRGWLLGGPSTSAPSRVCPPRPRPKIHPDRFLLTSSKSQPNGWGEDLLSNLRCWEGGRAADPGVKPATLANDYMVFVGTGWGQRPEIDWQIEAKAQGASQQVEIRINVNLLG